MVSPATKKADLGGVDTPPSANCLVVHNPAKCSVFLRSTQGHGEISFPFGNHPPHTPYSHFVRKQQLAQLAGFRNCITNYITITLHLHYNYIYNYITITLQLHYNYITITLHLHYNYITVQLQYNYILITLQLHYNYNYNYNYNTLHYITYIHTCVCVYIYIHIYIYTYVYIYIYTHIHTYNIYIHIIYHISHKIYNIVSSL